MAVAVAAQSERWSGVGQRWAWSEAFWEGPRVRGGVGDKGREGAKPRTRGRLGLGATFSCTLQGLSAPGLRLSPMLAAGTGPHGPQQLGLKGQEGTPTQVPAVRGSYVLSLAM